MIFSNESILEDLEGLDEEGYLDEDFGEDPLLALESISNAIAVIDSISRSVAVLESSANLPDKDKAQLLRASRIHRQSVMESYHLYQFSHLQVTATESDGLVFAIEEEADAQKGVISRMIDAVVNAFKWLWEKITSIFKSAEKPEDSKKAAEALMADLEAAISKKDEIPSGAVIDDDRYGKAFAGLGEAIDMSKVDGSLDVQKTAHELITGLIADTVDHLSKAKGMVDQMASGSKDAGEVYTEFSNNTKASVAKFVKNQMQAGHVELYAFASAGENINVAQSYIAGDYVAAEGPSSFAVYWSLGKSSDTSKGKFKAGFRPRAGMDKTAKISLPGKLSEVKPVAEKILAYCTEQAAAFEEAQKMNPESKAKDFQRELESIKGKFTAEQKDASEKVKMFINYANGMGAIMTGTIQFMKAMDSSAKIYRGLIAEIIKKAGGTSGKGEKKEEGDSNKPEAPPVDGGSEVVQQKSTAEKKKKGKKAEAEAAPTAPAA